MLLSFRTFLCILVCVVLVTAQGSSKSTSRTSTTTSSRNKGRGRGGASSTSYTRTTTTTSTSSSRSSSSSSSLDDSFFDDFFSDAPPGSSFSSGSSSTSGSSASGSTVYVRTSSSVSSGKPNKDDEGGSKSKGKGNSKAKGKGKGRESRSVEVGEGTVTSSSSASGSGTVRASASATVTPGRERGTASTTVGGKTRTTEESRPRKETGSSSSREKTSLPICRGLAKFKCCDDQKYYEIDGAVYCGCFGSRTKKDLCFYRRISEDPLVIRDVFGANQGEECQCAPTDHEPCIGVMRKECCEGYNGRDPRCFCPDEDEHCHYEVISKEPLIWRDNRFGKTTCMC